MENIKEVVVKIFHNINNNNNKMWDENHDVVAMLLLTPVHLCLWRIMISRSANMSKMTVICLLCLNEAIEKVYGMLSYLVAGKYHLQR